MVKQAYKKSGISTGSKVSSLAKMYDKYVRLIG